MEVKGQLQIPSPRRRLAVPQSRFRLEKKDFDSGWNRIPVTLYLSGITFMYLFLAVSLCIQDNNQIQLSCRCSPGVMYSTELPFSYCLIPYFLHISGSFIFRLLFPFLVTHFSGPFPER